MWKKISLAQFTHEQHNSDYYYFSLQAKQAVLFSDPNRPFVNNLSMTKINYFYLNYNKYCKVTLCVFF